MELILFPERSGEDQPGKRSLLGSNVIPVMQHREDSLNRELKKVTS
jgi:hypothetical protein